MPSRIVLACWGSYGDLFPYLRLAARLKARGHVPVLATCAYYRELVESRGVEFTPLSPDVDPADEALLARVMDPVRGTEIIVRELLVPYVRRAYEELTAAAAGAALLVSHPVTFAAPLVGERQQMTWLSTALAPASFFSAHDFPLLPPRPGVVKLARATPWAARGFMRIARAITGPWTAPVREFREELHLADRGDPLYEGQFSPHGTLALFPPMFGAPQPDWPVRTKQTGFIFDDEDAALPPDLQAFLDAGDAPIVFTLGSSAVGAAGTFFRAAAAAAGALKRRAVLLVGKDPRNRLDPAPPGLFMAEFAPHAALFPRAAAIVHHGGVGTTAEALRSGRPMLVVPHAHDQPDNAFRAARLGVARVLDARAFKAERAARELRALLSDPRYAVRAEELGRTLRLEDGAGAASDGILRCVQ